MNPTPNIVSIDAPNVDGFSVVKSTYKIPIPAIQHSIALAKLRILTPLFDQSLTMS